MATHNYIIRFESLRARMLYTLNITGGSGEPIELIGGAKPFFTEEDDADDIFTFMRTQSGYITVFDNGFGADGETPFDWKDLIPSSDLSRPVILTDGTGIVVWQGYIQAQDFGQEMYGNPQERQYPVQCMLSVLSSQDMDDEVRNMHNFAYLLQSAFSILSGITVNRFLFHGKDIVPHMLCKLIDWQNFMEKDSDGNIQSKYDYQTAVEDVCKFWGWSVRQQGQDIIFCTGDISDGSDVVEISPTDLDNIARGLPYNLNYPSWEVKSINGEVFVNKENKEYYLRGYNKAVVNASVNEADNMLFSAFPDEVEDGMLAGNGYGELNIEYSDNVYSFDTPYVTGLTESAHASFNLAIDDEGTKYKVIRIYETYNGTAFATVKLNFEHAYHITSPSRLFLVKRRGIRLSFGLLSGGTPYEEYDSSGISLVSVKMRISLIRESGTLWFNGRSWSPTTAHISVRMRKYGSGDVIPTDADGTYGKLCIEILGSDDMPKIGGDSGTRKFDITDFEVEFVESWSQWWSFGNKEVHYDTEHTYVARNGSPIKGEWSCDTIYASDNKTSRGYGIVINENGSRLSTFDYNGIDEYPEQRMANRVSDFWRNTRRKIHTELNYAMVGSVSPLQRVSIAGISGHPLSISHDWYNDILKLDVIEV